MRYFEMFTGIAGFSKGIEQAYDIGYQYEPAKSRPSDSGSGRFGNADKGRGDVLLADDAPLRRSGAECVGFSEIGAVACGILRHRFPEVKNYGDAALIDCDTLPDFDFLCGGFPCQSWSVAGKRKGFEDARGTLFYEIARVLSHKRPRHFLLENVKGLLSADGGAAFAEILRILTELGYRVETVVLNSKHYGVPQNRERVFFIGHLGTECEREILSFGEGDGGNFEALREQRSLRGRGKTDAGCLRTRGVNQFDRADLDNLIYPELMTIGGTQEHQHWRDDNISPSLTEAMGKGGGQTPMVALNNERAGNRVYDAEGIAATVTANVTGGTKNERYKVDKRIRRLTPVECARLQGFPDDWADLGMFQNKKGEWHIREISDTGKYQVFGNAVTVNVIEAVITRMRDKGCLSL
jgi:DNA (cytosine-5)-methyltransferase 1